MRSSGIVHPHLRSALIVLALITVPAVAQRATVLLPGSNTNAALKAATDAITTTDLNVLTPQQVGQALLGPGVTISNVVSTGAPESIGIFSATTSALGFMNGIILSSGNIASVPGPNTSDAITTDTLTAGDPQLSQMSGFPTFNAASLDFDFVAAGATQISFQYVFSSEEYNEWVGTQYNDIFAFFLNGQNLALLPSLAPVSVNNVNCGNPYNPPSGSNCALYINNRCSDLPAGMFPCAGAVDTEMDGLTVVLTATGTVQPGVNHIRLIIADAGDAILDSNVFIRAQSFTPGNPAPFFDVPTPCGQTVHAIVGTAFAYNVVAKAATGLPGNAVTLSSGPLPTGGSHAPSLPLLQTGPNATASAFFAWTPQAADIGTHTINYLATDQLAQTASCTVTIDVADPVVTTGVDYMFLGLSPTSFVIPNSNGKLLLTSAELYLQVFQEQIPEWIIPPALIGYHVYVQFGIYDPDEYPTDPIQMSNGVDVHVGFNWSSYGPTTMGIDAFCEDPPLVFQPTSFRYERQN